MTFAAPRPLTSTASVSGRALAKQRTREKILQAARTLFNERGYDGATVRDIARAAGLSTGAVFASFADKADLFDEIVAGDYRALEAEMAGALARARNVEDALLGLFSAAYRSHAHQLPMVWAAMSAGWTRDAEKAPRSREALKPIVALVGDALRQGAERGEIDAGADIELLRGIVWEIYLSGYRAAVYDNLTVEAMIGRLGDQLRLILAGVRAG